MFKLAVATESSGLPAGCASDGQNRYHRADARRYRERKLSRQDRVYRGEDGRYYCRRSDGTTGLIIGAVAGGAVDRNRDMRCR